MRKVFVDVMVQFVSDGSINPIYLIWPDGRRYDIDKIIDIRKAASHSVGGQGYRYTCRICNREKYLFLEDDKWFMEGK